MRLAVPLQAFWKSFGISVAAILLTMGIAPPRAAAQVTNQPVPFIEAIGPVAVTPGGALFTPREPAITRRSAARVIAT